MDAYLQKLNRKMHLSKVKHSKFNESGQLLVFYVVSAVWGTDIIIRVSCWFHKLEAPVFIIPTLHTCKYIIKFCMHRNGLQGTIYFQNFVWQKIAALKNLVLNVNCNKIFNSSVAFCWSCVVNCTAIPVKLFPDGLYSYFASGLHFGELMIRC